MKFLKAVIRKSKQIKAIIGGCSNPLPCILDSVRLKKAKYRVSLYDHSLQFDLRGGEGDWFTLLECCIRKDYFVHPIFLKDGDVIVDIGGNFGAFSVMAARIVGPCGMVKCYEPGPTSFERILGHKKVNKVKNLEVINAGVAGQSASMKLYHGRKSALNSLFESIDGREMNTKDSVIVRVLSIGAVLEETPKKIALMKIDCEGAEYDIFDHLDDAQISRVTQFAIETHSIPGRSGLEIRKRLENLGYGVTGINPFLAVKLDQDAINAHIA